MRPEATLPVCYKELKFVSIGHLEQEVVLTVVHIVVVVVCVESRIGDRSLTASVDDCYGGVTSAAK